MRGIKQIITTVSCLSVLLALFSVDTDACTGIRLIAKDNSVVYGRTVELGAFDLKSRDAIVPRGYGFTGLTPDGYNGKHWKTRHCFVAVDMLEKDIFADAMNEKGLAVGLFYHPGFATYMEYDKAKAANTITAVDVISYILGNFAAVAEVDEGMKLKNIDFNPPGAGSGMIGLPGDYTLPSRFIRAVAWT